MELAVDTDERFKFPFFELCNIYAAKSIAESLEGLSINFLNQSILHLNVDCTEGGQFADHFQIDIATLLLEKCGKWIQEMDKFSLFNGTLKQLKRQLGRQTVLQRRIKSSFIE